MNQERNKQTLDRPVEADAHIGIAKENEEKNNDNVKAVGKTTNESVCGANAKEAVRSTKALHKLNPWFIDPYIEGDAESAQMRAFYEAIVDEHLTGLAREVESLEASGESLGATRGPKYAHGHERESADHVAHAGARPRESADKEGNAPDAPKVTSSED